MTAMLSPLPVFSRRQFLGWSAMLAIASLLKPLCSFSEEVSGFESRAILDEGLNWVTKTSAENLCRRIKRAGFNVFIPCVWHGRGTVWPSRLSPWDSHNRQIAGFDPLENLIQSARRYEVEVHPWFTVMLRQRDFLSAFYDDGTPSNAFDVHREAFRDFIVSLILEVATGYPVHGINLDFVRAGGVCQSLHCIEDYKRQTGRDLLTDSRNRMVPGADMTELIRWQEKAVGDIVRRLASQIRRFNREIVISVDAAPGNPIVEMEGQNSIRWADEGWIDVIYDMSYQYRPDFEGIRSLQSKMKRPEAMVVLCGNFDRVGPRKEVVPRDARRVAELLNESRAIGVGNGLGLYLYSMLSDEQIDLLSKTVFQSLSKPRWMRAKSTDS
jgi:hypothetical protein